MRIDGAHVSKSMTNTTFIQREILVACEPVQDLSAVPSGDDFGNGLLLLIHRAWTDALVAGFALTL